LSGIFLYFIFSPQKQQYHLFVPFSLAILKEQHPEFFFVLALAYY